MAKITIEFKDAEDIAMARSSELKRGYGRAKANKGLHLATLDSRDGDAQSPSSGSGHLFSGYYLPYPDSGYEGLVSTISNDPPMLNWIYVDKDTHEVKYGERSVAQEHVTGPFDCTSQDRRLTLEGWEGFAAVEEPSGVWTLYFDRDDDGLATKVPLGTRVLEVELDRREKKEPKPSSDEPPAQTVRLTGILERLWIMAEA
ncbi:hypothetical protein PLIIFM63780_009018 [Purpureocillium lilacinum]|nr:hypothetical protein PLIIFM63780_009018 [Purpureocillium lilacinum]